MRPLISPFPITASFHIKDTSVLMLSCGLTQQHMLASYWLLRFLFISSLPQHAPLSISPSVTRINTRCSFLEYIFGLIKPWCFASQLLLGLTRKTTIW
ncbi:unnamed protein product [Hymenolepis diminuta]|uniref:Uncharacterized protein n=1 Tax=Hymenolepis diminuta TaxID=6216 RepID=A0A564Y5X2_HYMDI|nr:unnamed protein product [Hymenolepis diminuta]